jgi:hypothetical protein
MLIRASSLIAGSAVAAASVLGIVNASSSATLKEPATGIGALRSSLSRVRQLDSAHW